MYEGILVMVVDGRRMEIPVQYTDIQTLWDELLVLADQQPTFRGMTSINKDNVHVLATVDKAGFPSFETMDQSELRILL